MTTIDLGRAFPVSHAGRVFMSTAWARWLGLVQGAALRALHRLQLFFLFLLGLLALLSVVQLTRTEVKERLAFLEKPGAVARVIQHDAVLLSSLRADAKPTPEQLDMLGQTVAKGPGHDDA